MEEEGLDFRSPSLELAKIQVSPGFFPNREPSGSVLITCSMAFPTSPEPPVTRTTSPVVMIVRDCRFAVIGTDPNQAPEAKMSAKGQTSKRQE